ncbi:hypothetical protein DHEL01_v204079 [Diaporthe helianthi]|uniref:DNA/RNA-binding protein Alba-like domain-containing protein n=1 Tax=Diaporthe helianthi TaxID=158607 RepID=A0A2P5I4V8_DIAHE|nr:hypothetical protein DHEL01_v204079 [Diaporthe helianthi]
MRSATASSNSTTPNTAAGAGGSGGTKRPASEIDVPETQSSSSGINSNKRQRVGHSNSTIPVTLPMQPHEELLQELQGKYSIATASFISSSKINKKVTQVLSHLGHVDLFNQTSTPGVMMVHARANDANKMVTVMEIAKRHMNQAGQPWYQYNRVYEVADGRGSKSKSNDRGADQTVVENTVLGGEDADEDDEEDDFEPVQTAFERAIQEKPAEEPKTTYMSIFLSRVPMPELQSKAYMTLQTNGAEIGKASGPVKETQLR